MSSESAFLGISVVVAFAAGYLILARWKPGLRRWSSLYLTIALVGSIILLLAAFGPVVHFFLFGPDSD